MPSNNYIYKMSNAGGMSNITRYVDMLAGNAAFIAFTQSAFDSIATVDVGAGGASSIDFTSIPSTYTHLQIRIWTKGDTAGDQDANIRLGNGSIDTGSNYAWHAVYGNGASAAATSGTTTTRAVFGFNYAIGTGAANTGSVSVIDLLDYANTSKYKTIRTLSGGDKNGSGTVGLYSGLWQSTNAVNAIRLYPDSGNFAQYSSFALYGIKAA